MNSLKIVRPDRFDCHSGAQGCYIELYTLLASDYHNVFIIQINHRVMFSECSVLILKLRKYKYIYTKYSPLLHFHWLSRAPFISLIDIILLY